MGQKTNMWLKRIFSVSTLTTVATVVATCIAIIQYVESNGGTFVAFVNNEEAKPPIKKTILVYLDKDSADLSQLGIFPKITNPSKYSLQDVMLTYRIDSKSSNIYYSDYFSIHRVAKGEQVTNIDKTLYAKTDMPEPFYYFIIKDNGEATIDIRATYKGVDDPFAFQADVFARRLNLIDYDKRKQAIFNDASILASNKNLNNVDLYILDNENVETFRDLPLSKMSERSAVTQNQIVKQKDAISPAHREIIERNSEVKTVKQIETEKEETVTASKESQGNPWFMYIVGGILFLVQGICFIGVIAPVVVFEDLKTKDRIIFALGFILATFIGYLCFYYFQTLFGDYPIERFWTGLSIAYVITISFDLLCYISNKTRKRLGISDDNETWIFLVYLVFLSIPVYYICKFILDTFTI